MSIPQAISYQLPQMLYALGSKLSWDVGAAASSTLEAAFYGSLKGGVQSSEKLVKWIKTTAISYPVVINGIEQGGRLVNWMRETAIARIQAIQVIFNIANAAIILYSTKKLLDEFQGNYSFALLNMTAAYWVLKSVPVILGLGLTVTVGVVIFNHFSPALAPEREEKGVKVSETLSKQQRVAKVLHMTKLVLNVALACFIKNRFWFAISLATSTYSLLKNVQLKWITFSRTFPGSPGGNITLVKATYNMLAVPPDSSATTEKCAICHDQANPIDMAFCANHVFHQTCMADLSLTKANSFIDGSRFVKVETKHYTNGQYTGTSYSYKATVLQDNFPSCPSCRDIPLQNDCDIEVTDRLHGRFNAGVTIVRPPVDRQYLFENLYALYNTAQAGLTYLQTYPELAGMIFKIQQVMLVTDLIGYAFTSYYLLKKMNAQFNPENSLKFKIASVAALVAVAALSYFAVLQINALLRSSIVLKDLLAQLDISPEVLKNIEISWKSPLSHQLLQVLYVNRLVTAVALSCFSEQKKTSLLSIAAILLGLVGISRLRFIELTQTLDWPLQKIVASGGKLSGYLHQKSLKSLKLTSHFLVDRSCTINPIHLKSTLQSIYNYTSSFFNKSSWDNYWLVTSKNGVEISRKLYYTITLQTPPLQACGCSLTPNLTDYTIKAIDAVYGSVNISIQA